MDRLVGALASATSGVFLSTLALTVVSGRYEQPESLPALFLTVALLAGPFALFLGYFVRELLENSAAGGSSFSTLAVEAYWMSLGLAVPVLFMTMFFQAFFEGSPDRTFSHILPRLASVVLAGCTGLAYGALWRLPREIEE